MKRPGKIWRETETIDRKSSVAFNRNRWPVWEVAIRWGGGKEVTRLSHARGFSAEMPFNGENRPYFGGETMRSGTSKIKAVLI